jgi:hypothetical protein
VWPTLESGLAEVPHGKDSHIIIDKLIADQIAAIAETDRPFSNFTGQVVTGRPIRGRSDSRAGPSRDCRYGPSGRETCEPGQIELSTT